MHAYMSQEKADDHALLKDCVGCMTDIPVVRETGKGRMTDCFAKRHVLLLWCC